MTRGFQLRQKQMFNEGGEGEGGEGSNADDQNQGTNDNGGNGGGEGGDPNKGAKPTDREAELLKEVMKRKGSEQALKNDLNNLKGELKKFEGIDPEAVRALLAEKAERETAELEKRGEFDRVKQQMREQHQNELTTVKTTFEGQLTETQRALAAATSQITELTIGRAFGDSTFVRDTLTLTPAKARVVYGSHFELQDGKVVAYDAPAGSAQRTVLVDGSGEPLSFDQAIEKIVKADPDHEHLVRSKVKSGAGSNNDSTARTTPKVGSGRDRIAAAVASGALKLKQ
jgi:hypothetical protein